MIIISPSKNLNLNSENFDFNTTQPILFDRTLKVIDEIRKLNILGIKNLMKISDNLAKLNHERFQKINQNSNPKKPAGFMFSGDTFNGLSIRSLEGSELLLAQQRLRILSGLYGVLRPFDLIEPYRLEMGTSVNRVMGENLYDFWGKKITNQISKDLEENNSKYLFNLASKEYFSVINQSNINSKIINFDFKKQKGSELANIGMQIKKIRGSMARFILQKKVKSIDELKSFNEYSFNFYSFDEINNKLLFVSK